MKSTQYAEYSQMLRDFTPRYSDVPVFSYFYYKGLVEPSSLVVGTGVGASHDSKCTEWQGLVNTELTPLFDSVYLSNLTVHYKAYNFEEHETKTVLETCSEGKAVQQIVSTLRDTTPREEPQSIFCGQSTWTI
jgi:hypothetical protein